MKKRIAIIGAGISGLTLANRLNHSFDVVVFEKSRGVGGRMATRNAEPFKFDHGTQFFTVRDKNFSTFISPFINSGIVSEWKGKVITLEAEKKQSTRLWFEPHYVACPGMNSLCKKLAEGITLRLNCEIGPLIKGNNGTWQLTDINNQKMGEFDLVISTAPPIQTCKLFHDFLPKQTPLFSSKFLSCFTLMFGFHKPWDNTWIAAKVKNSPIEWIAVNSSKPGRDNTKTTLVVHSSNVWAEEHVNDELSNTETVLRNEVNKVLNIELDYPDYFSLHRWRYALVNKPKDMITREVPYYDKSLNLACVGDWVSQSRIEDVWIQANQLAESILS
jgi:renalase